MKAALGCLFSALVFLLGSPAWPANADRGAGLSRPACFGPVSRAWAVELKGFARSLGRSAYPIDPDMTVLAKINAGRARERRLLAPLVRSLREMGYTPAKFRGLDREERRRLMSAQIGNRAVNEVIAEVHYLRDRAENPRAGSLERRQIRRALDRIRTIVELYAPFKERMLQAAYDNAR